MKIVYLAAGAAGMYCGSCMRDNRLAATLMRQGHDVSLIPLYTPLKTDEVSVSQKRVLYGGINVYLQEKFTFFRRAPHFVDRFFDVPALLKGVGRWAAKTKAEELGALTVSVLEGAHGPQRKELDKLITELARLSPSLINLPNLMFTGVASALKEALGAPVLCMLSGEDIFLDQLPDPWRRRAFELIAQADSVVDGYVATTHYYARHAARHFNLSADRIDVVPLGIDPAPFARAEPPDEPFTIGYMARICPEKGLARLCETFIRLRRKGRDCRLRVAGFPGDRDYLRRLQRRLRDERMADHVDFLGEVSLRGKVDLLRSLHVLSVPTAYPEAKGLFVIEALACGVPVVQPNHGSFPELIEATGGGVLFDPDRPEAHVEAIELLMDDPAHRRRLAEHGYHKTREHFTHEEMARRAWAVHERYAPGAPASREGA